MKRSLKYFGCGIYWSSSSSSTRVHWILRVVVGCWYSQQYVANLYSGKCSSINLHLQLTRSTDLFFMHAFYTILQKPSRSYHNTTILFHTSIGASDKQCLIYNIQDTLEEQTLWRSNVLWHYNKILKKHEHYQHVKCIVSVFATEFNLRRWVWI